MPDDTQTYTLRLDATDGTLKNLTPVELDIEEMLSGPYCARVLAHTADPTDPGSVDPGTWLRTKAAVGIARGDDLSWLHGVVVAVEHVGEDPKQRQIYRIELAPGLTLLRHTRRVRVFVDKKPIEVVKQVLQEHSLTIDMKATGAAGQALRHITQFEESDFDFVARLLEQEGACYWFTHTSSAHTMVVGDAANHHPGSSAAIAADYAGTAAGSGSGAGAITELTRRYAVVAKETAVYDYSESHPKSPAQGEKAVTASKAPGAGGRLGEGDYHVTASDSDASAYATRLVDGQMNRSCSLVGGGNVSTFHAGARVAVHGKDGYDEHLLLLTVNHRLHGDVYSNTFTAMPVGRMPWRPPRLTPIPRIQGVVPAIVTATAGDQGGGQDGSYRVKLLGSNDNADRIVRMAQPYAGPAQGVHFPLPVDTEVLLTHEFGHPDRPVIAGAMHNAEDPSPVAEGNKTQCVVKSAVGAVLIFEDKQDEEKVTLASKTVHKLEFDDKEKKVTLASKEAHKLEFADQDEKVTLTSKGEQKLEIDDKNKVTHLSIKDEKVTVDGKSETTIKGKQTITCQDEIEISATKKITLKVGQASITIDSSGKIEIAGMEIAIAGKTKATMDAAEVAIAAKTKLAASGAVVGIEAQGQLEAKANGMLTVQSSGITTVKGSMVMIN